MFCIECGNKRSSNGDFCINCGKKFVADHAATVGHAQLVDERGVTSWEVPNYEYRDRSTDTVREVPTDNKKDSWEDYFNDHEDDYSHNNIFPNKPYAKSTRSQSKTHLQNDARLPNRVAQQRNSKQPQNSKNPLIAAIVLFAIAAIGLAAWFILRENTPDTVEGWLDLGERSLIQRDYEQALISFRNVIEIEPENPRGYTGSAEAYLGMEKPEEAIGILQHGREMLPNEPAITEMIREVVEEFPYIRDEPTTVLFETPPILEDSSIAEPTPNIGEPALDWRVAYRSFIEQYVEQMINDGGDPDLVGFNGRLYIHLFDLNFDGIPELIIDYETHGATREIFYLSDSGVKPVLNNGFVPDIDISNEPGSIQLFEDKITGAQMFVSSSVVSRYGNGFIREFSSVDGVLVQSQIIHIIWVYWISDIRDNWSMDDWDYYDTIWRHSADGWYCETLTITDNPQMFRAYAYDIQSGHISAISPLEYLDLKRDYMNRFEVLETDSWNFPATMTTWTRISDTDFNEFFAMWN